MARVYATLEQLRNRSTESNDLLFQSIGHSKETRQMLGACLKAVFTVCKNGGFGCCS